MEYRLLESTLLFRGLNAGEIEGILPCLGAEVRTYEKGAVIRRLGETADSFGLVLSGGVVLETDDLLGNSRAFSYVEPGRPFGEIYACLPGEPMLVRAVADEETRVLFLNGERLMQTCPRSCPCHHTLIRNLLNIFARKSLALSKRVLNISSRSIRGKLLSFLSQQAMEHGSSQFSIPYDRQELADYLGVDRSALCNELSKLRCEGILTYRKNLFRLEAPPEPAGREAAPDKNGTKAEHA